MVSDRSGGEIQDSVEFSKNELNAMNESKGIKERERENCNALCSRFKKSGIHSDRSRPRTGLQNTLLNDAFSR